MADVAGPVFEQVATSLENRTDLDKLEARGTLRLAVKQAGLDANSVTIDQIRVVLEKVMPAELAVRGVEASVQVCEGLVAELPSLEATPGSNVDAPETVFTRLGGS